MKKSFTLTVFISIIVTLMFSLVSCLEWDPSAEGENTNERGDWVFSIPALVKWMTGQDTASSTQEEQVEVAENAETPKQEEQTPSSENAPASEDISQKSEPESQSNSSESNQEPKSYSVPDDWPLPYNDKISLEFTNKGTGENYTSWDVQGFYPGSAKEIYSWYKEQLSGFNETTDKVSDMGNNNKRYEYRIENDS